MTIQQFAHAQEFIYEAELTEKSLSNRLNAAIYAKFALDPITGHLDPDISLHMHIKVSRRFTDTQLARYYDINLGLAKQLLLNLETHLMHKYVPRAYPEYKCPNCGRVHVAIPLSTAEKALGISVDISGYFHCFSCPTPTSDFIPASPSDAPDGSTLTPIVVPGAW